MIVKVILVILLSAYKGGGIDHIEFKTMSQCLKAKQQLEINYPFGMLNVFAIKCDCIEVTE